MNPIVLDSKISKPIINVEKVDSPTNDAYLETCKKSNEILKKKIQNSISCDILFKD